MNAYQQLETLFRQLSRLAHFQALGSWDEATMMPAGAGDARASAMGTLNALMHDMLCQDKVGHWLEQALEDNSLDQWQYANAQLMQRRYLQATCLPSRLVEELTEKSMQAERAWRHLRAENNWRDFAPKLEQVFNLVLESASIRAEVFEKTPYDILIDQFSPGTTQAIIDPIFASLKQHLPELIQQIIHKQQQQPAIKPHGHFAIETQKILGMELMQAIGFDFNHGRLDTSHHPFCGGVASDVRITTRYTEHEFVSAMMGICHETGHAMYERQLPAKWQEQPVGEALGMTLHESQSLLVEMQACRSIEFMHFITPKLVHFFGAHDSFTPDNLFRLYTTVQPGLIRVDADEVTYPLHVILRYEIERDLFAGRLSIGDLPDVWDQKMTEYLGISTKGDYKNGVMQDVHWPSAGFGYFPAYTLGRLYGAQFYASALKKHPEIPQQIQQGDFTTLMAWLADHVHGMGSLLPADELLLSATGSTLAPQFFLEHIHQRYLA